MTDDMLRATVSVRGVAVTAGGRTLVVRRTADGEWELPGGRLGAEEDVEAGLAREFAEETTLSVDVGEVVHANAWRNDTDDGRFAVHYRCRVDGRDVTLSAEHDRYRWVPYADAAGLLPDPQAAAVRRARPDAEADGPAVPSVSASSD